MTITDRNAIREGMTLTANYKGETHEVLVLADEQGRLAFEYRNQIFKSPSSAGSAIMGGIACNGWRFWTRANEVGDRPAAEAPAADEPKAKKTKPSVAPEKRMLKVIKRIPNQIGVPDGSTKFHCSACMKSFVAEGKSVPAACPEGHAAEQQDDTFTVDGATDAA